MSDTVVNALERLTDAIGGGGAGGGVMVVTMNNDTNELSASYDELKSALLSGKHIDFMDVISMPNEESVNVYSLTAITYVNNLYSAFFGDDFHFISDSSTEPMEASIS